MYIRSINTNWLGRWRYNHCECAQNKLNEEKIACHRTSGRAGYNLVMTAVVCSAVCDPKKGMRQRERKTTKQRERIISDAHDETHTHKPYRYISLTEMRSRCATSYRHILIIINFFSFISCVVSVQLWAHPACWFVEWLLNRNVSQNAKCTTVTAQPLIREYVTFLTYFNYSYCSLSSFSSTSSLSDNFSQCVMDITSITLRRALIENAMEEIFITINHRTVGLIRLLVQIWQIRWLVKLFRMHFDVLILEFFTFWK